MKFLREWCLVLPEWPTNSPDLNPIEIIWAIMKLRIKKLAPKTKEELERTITAVWEELEPDVLNRLVRNFRKRREPVIKARGRSISQYLSSHRSEATEEDAAANSDFRAFEEEEDAAILDWVQLIGNRWKRITEILAPRFGSRERSQIKHPAKFLMDRLSNERRESASATGAAAAVSGEEEGERAPFNPRAFFAGPAFDSL
jgi:hypothetical protein